MILHPDKNKDKDTTEAFRELSKAMEVLGDETQKELYDYYLDHPRVSNYLYYYYYFLLLSYFFLYYFFIILNSYDRNIIVLLENSIIENYHKLMFV